MSLDTRKEAESHGDGSREELGTSPGTEVLSLSEDRSFAELCLCLDGRLFPRELGSGARGKA